MDLENLNPTHSRIICSAPITRFRTITKDIDLNDNEEEFCILEYLKNMKDKQLKSNQQKCCPRLQPVTLKRKHHIKDTDGIIKRFKHSFAHKDNTGTFNETDHKNSGIVSIPMSVSDETWDGIKLPELLRRKQTDTIIFQERSIYSTESEVDDYAASSSTDVLFSDEQFEKLFYFDCSSITPK